MVKMLICDDDSVFATKLRELIREFLKGTGISAQIEVFQCKEDIPDAVFSKCDIAFLDIDFSGKTYTGIDIARRVRNACKNAVIIFVTNYPSYAPEGYEVQAFRYLLKNEMPQKLKRYLTQALQQLDTDKQALRINISGEIISIPLKEITYIEAQLRKACVYTVNDLPGTPPKYTYYSKISDLEKELESSGFVRIQKSYLVNMRYIRRYQCTEVLLKNGVKLPASKLMYAEQKKKYILWWGK